MTVALFLLAVFLSFFILYLLSKHDFVLLRKNISLAQIFDLAFMTVPFAFIFGRILFVFDYSQFSLFHLIKFFHFFRFPGISFLGSYLGGVLALYFLFRKKKALSRTYDIFTLSFFPLFVFNILARKYPGNLFVLALILFFLVVGLFVFFIKSHNSYKLRDGMISFLFLSILSFDNFVFQFLDPKRMTIYSLSISQFLSILIFLFSITSILLNRDKN